MNSFVNFNGRFYKKDEPLLKINNRAFCYGDALFETMRWHDNRILFIRDHFDRLLKGMKFLKMEIPAEFSEAFFQKQIGKLVEKNKIRNDARIRMQVYRKEGGYYSPSDNSPGFVITAEDINQARYSLNKNGLTTGVFTEMKKLKNPISNLKTSNSIIYVLAGIFKEKNNDDDSFILNTEGKITDSISSNVFIVKNKVLITPPLSDGCVDGVLRQNILRICKKEKIKIKEKPITENDLLLSEEIFLSNTVHGIRWVKKFRNKFYINKFSISLTEKLNQFINKN